MKTSKRRRLALEFAANMLACREYDEDTLKLTYSWAVFYENYLEYGADITDKRMKIMPRAKVVKLKVIK